MEYTLISSQDLIDYLDANSTVPHKSGNRCKLSRMTFFLIVTTHWARNIDFLPKRFDQKML